MLELALSANMIADYIKNTNPKPTKRFNLERKITEALRIHEMSEYDSIVLRDKIRTEYNRIKAKN